MKNIKRTVRIILVITLLFVNLWVPVVQAAEAELVTITKDNYVADTLNGVDAIYRPGSSDGSSSTYSCAAFIKKYYKEVYHVKVYNLFYNSSPKSYGGEKFIKVTKPQVGDIAACSTDHNTTHWAIVKELNGDDAVTLIEQNWKWTQGGKTVTTINRSAKISSIRFYRLEDQNELEQE